MSLKKVAPPADEIPSLVLQFSRLENGLISRRTLPESVSDLWNYQEIVFQLRPSLIVEFGVYSGGSSLYFAEIANLVGPGTQVLAVDVSLENLAPSMSWQN